MQLVNQDSESCNKDVRVNMTKNDDGSFSAVVYILSNRKWKNYLQKKKRFEWNSRRGRLMLLDIFVR